MKSNIYVTFNGNCEEAMTYYADVLGGEIAQKMKFSDAPEADLQFPAEVMDLTMHCELKAGDFSILASDYFNPQEGHKVGNNFSISISTKDENQAYSIFNSFAEEGKVLMPLEEAFWGGKFGMLRDKFDINWMVSLEEETYA